MVNLLNEKCEAQLAELNALKPKVKEEKAQRIEKDAESVSYTHLFLNLFYIYCSKASLLKAGNLVFKALGAVSALYMMTLTTPLSEIIAVLRKAHVPKLIIELMNMIYRYIFIMIDTHSRMKNSAESRLGYCDFKTSCYSFGPVSYTHLDDDDRYDQEYINR